MSSDRVMALFKIWIQFFLKQK